MPSRLRVPLRYHVQRFAGALEPEIALLADLVPPQGIALDVGANRGIYAYALARIAKEVHCFEPLAECCSYIAAYRSPKIKVHNCALADVPGLLSLYVPLSNGRPILTRASLDRPTGAASAREIEVRTLDSFDFPKIDFIKIDVEGLEASVLRGAQRMLARDRPRLLVEIDRERHSGESFQALMDWLHVLGYEAHVLTDGVLKRCRNAWDEASTHYNFIFLPVNRNDASS